MSAPPRSTRGGGLSRGRAGTPTAPKRRGRGSDPVRGGRGRGGANVSTNSKAETLLQGLQSGSFHQRPGASRRGSGEKNTSALKARMTGIFSIAVSFS